MSEIGSNFFGGFTGCFNKMNSVDAAVLNFIEDNLAVIKPDGEVLFLNNNFIDSFVKDRSLIKGKNLFSLVDHDMANEFDEVIKSCIESRKAVIFESDWGGYVYCNRVFSVLDDDGEISSIIIFSKNITEQKRSERVLYRVFKEKESYRKYLSATLKSIPDAIITLDKDMKIVAANEKAVNNCSIGNKKYIDKSIKEVCNFEYTPCYKIIQEAMETRIPVRSKQVECILRRKSKRVVELYATPLIENNNEFAGIVLIIKDSSRSGNLDVDIKDRKSYCNIIGACEKMLNVYAQIERLADLDTNILVTGESGTGKELVAEALHRKSERHPKPLVKVNCSALTENLLESELFGHVRGAFTGAINNKTGLIQAAQGGTLFLDEIGEISPLTQVKLLRFLENKEYSRVGESHVRKADVRIIAATNADLKSKVSNGAFRDDLYYRLNIVNIHLPPLRERKEDIPLLVNYFTNMFNSKYDKKIIGVSENIMEFLIHYSWPGNVRQLKNTIEHASILCNGEFIDDIHWERTVNVEDINDYILDKDAAGRIDKKDIFKALTVAEGNKSKAARKLGIHRATLYRKMKKFDIEC